MLNVMDIVQYILDHPVVQSSLSSPYVSPFPNIVITITIFRIFVPQRNIPILDDDHQIANSVPFLVEPPRQVVKADASLSNSRASSSSTSDCNSLLPDDDNGGACPESSSSTGGMGLIDIS